MSASHPRDPLFDAIAGLPPVKPDDGHSNHVRNRCRAALDRPARALPVTLEPATVGTLCTIYAWHVMKIATTIPLP